MKKIVLLSAGSMLIAGSAVAATYTVQKGDWLSKIAVKHGMTLQQIADLNPQISNLNQIEIGQVINVSDRRATTTAKVAEVKEAPAKIESQPVVKAAKEKTCAACENVLDGNPLYRPAAGRFYSITTLGTDTAFDIWGLGTELGYGITDRLSLFVNLAGSTYKFDDYSWDSYGAGLSFRYLNDKNWKGDVYGKFNQLGVIDSIDGRFFTGAYNWTAGTKFGYTTCGWTLAGLFEYDWLTIPGVGDTFDGFKTYRVGAEGQYVFTKRWNVVAGITYEMPEFIENYFTGKLGVNYNFTNTAYLGLYATQAMGEKSGKLADDTGLALQFGIEF
ncbi:MAG: LysM peptidoglycan-binding domain-containing protein [Alphaproteobacteria bacterium]|nr:LysM peptidoglycan-binding domain-containing protein [Alphaproteobacteria bacterium]MCL2889825.1 LysM peptidoglycan-binding domain-containing protein [Alphaproteobacteria bacterium]